LDRSAVVTQDAHSPESVPHADGTSLLGFGTWQNDDPDQCAASVRTALETGYRHIDTAQIYRNEGAVGDGIAAADVAREDVFLATNMSIDERERQVDPGFAPSARD